MKSNLVYFTLAGLLLFIGGGLIDSFLLPQTHAQPYPKTGGCEQIDRSTLRLSGPIDDAMRDCALAEITPDIETVIVTTNGGEVFAGRAIGYKIGEQPRHLIVDRVCLSSCGNYFVPAAARVTLRAGSVIGLHGSPDPHMLSNIDMENHLASLVEDNNVTSEGLTRILKRKSDRRAKQLAEEAKFAAHFNVPKGWRHYREAGDADDGWRRHFVEGSDVNVVPKNFMIVEEPMMASCLPDVKIAEFQDTLEATVLDNAKFWTSLKETMGAYRSLNLTCNLAPSPQ